MLTLIPTQRTAGIGQLRRLDIALDAQLQVGQLVMRQPAHVLAGRLVAHDQRVGLRAVDQPQRHAGIGGVKQRALALDQVPMVGVVGRAQPLDRAGHEIGDDRVDRHAVAGDKDAGLAGGAEIGLEAARPHLLFERQRGEHLADRAVGADRQQALAGALDAVADRELAGRMAHVVRSAARAAPPPRATPGCRPGGDAARWPDPCRAPSRAAAGPPSPRRARRRGSSCRRSRS